MTNFKGWWPPSKKLVVVALLWAAFVIWNGQEFLDYYDVYSRGSAFAEAGAASRSALRKLHRCMHNSNRPPHPARQAEQPR